MYTKATPPLWNPSHFVATPPLWNLVYKNHLPASVRSGSSIQEYSALSSHLPVDLSWLGTVHVHTSVRRPEQPGHMEHEEHMFYSDGFTVGVHVSFPKMGNVGASE